MSSDVHTLSGAYALNALDPEEAAEFRRHLDGCPACRDEVRELQTAAARMGASEAVNPPPQLKGRILAAAARTPQQPPRPPAPAGSHAGSAGHQRNRLRWLAVAAAAVIVAGGGAVGIRAVVDDGPQLSPAAEQVFEADDARTTTVETTNGGRLTVGVSPSRDEMAIDTRGLPDPGDGRVYQLWAVHGDAVESAGLVEDLDEGETMGLPEEDTTVALTIEPAEGSEQPTSDPIVLVDPNAV